MERKSTTPAKTHRAKLLLAGYTYRTFARHLRVSEHTVKAAVHGVRNGKKAQRVIAALETLGHAT
jgi:DNA-binding CsgD family transcriptional regulator